ncbi:hypothetical protein HgNV_067 [Homarus gammarus nudivirus]|uniref:Uncharacterized protein n=1 Tax=Homarus gammarus nudivirus TaxID=2509616 RepID=A0A411HBA3_9VIRU|nr:hypothetical protein KM727_gp67 [Homarus gammarus nudivirus]QBB28672.1 hypothetical protein HgNV_067 [Homarus gammarus nudivirus]
MSAIPQSVRISALTRNNVLGLLLPTVTKDSVRFLPIFGTKYLFMFGKLWSTREIFEKYAIATYGSRRAECSTDSEIQTDSAPDEEFQSNISLVPSYIQGSSSNMNFVNPCNVTIPADTDDADQNFYEAQNEVVEARTTREFINQTTATVGQEITNYNLNTDEDSSSYYRTWRKTFSLQRYEPSDPYSLITNAIRLRFYLSNAVTVYHQNFPIRIANTLNDAYSELIVQKSKLSFVNDAVSRDIDNLVQMIEKLMDEMNAIPPLHDEGFATTASEVAEGRSGIADEDGDFTMRL